ncbi:hypothetical protein PQQ51_33430 [Paraburkholderia xenovorans]|uniref:hypothetical protein n=1 Tax=Paraburkholderia xenovorans TaxID=36873 RepID=UPI0038BB1EE4
MTFSARFKLSVAAYAQGYDALKLTDGEVQRIQHMSPFGHTLTFSPGAAGKALSELAELWNCGHPGGTVSVAQAGGARVSRVQAGYQVNAPYYRLLEKRK